MKFSKNLYVVAFGSAFAVGALLGNQSGKKPAPKKPVVNKGKTSTINKNINTNISVGDVVTKSNATIDLTVRYVDTMEVMQASKQGAEISGKLEKKHQELREKATQKQQDFQKFTNELQSKASMMNKEARNQAEADVVKRRRELETTLKSCEDELKLVMQQYTESISQDVRATVGEIAEKKGYDVVADSNSGNTIYVSPKAMITSEIITELDRKYVANQNTATKTKTA